MKRFWPPLAAALLLALAGAPLLERRVRGQPPAPSFSPALIAQGAALARLGDCAFCHTADGGRAFAGGRPVATPFGTVYATNITPDGETGAGRWTLADFDAALRRGVRRGGAQLYPAMPYDHYASLRPEDVRALYAFVMTRQPVFARTPGTRLIPPLGFRPLMLAWKWLFFHPQPPAADRGAYLVQALGHCGACHTPHGALGDERQAKALSGGVAEGWVAPALDAASPASSAWTEDRLYAYLRTGLDADHAAAAGPMGPVAHELARADEADVRAIAAYVAGRMRLAKAPAAPPVLDHAVQAAQADPEGAALFDGACAACHGQGAPMMLSGRPGLERGSPLWEDDPRDALQIMLQGLNPPAADAGPAMPAFADTLRNDQLAELGAYMRRRFTDQPAWSGLRAAAAKARRARAQG